MRLVRLLALQAPLFGLTGASAASATAPRSELAVRWASEPDLLSDLAGGVDAPGEEDDLPLLRLCVANSWWSGARAIVSRAHQRTPATGAPKALQDEVRGLMVDVKHHADELAAFADATYRGQTKGLSEVACALQWAQNSTTVFLAVKYAHRWSAPGAIEVRDVTVNISGHHFDLEGFGHHSETRKRYFVDLDLYSNVTVGESSWSSSSVGRLTAMLQKAKPNEKWRRLTKEKEKRHQLTSWMDMEERWRGELEQNTGNAKPRPTPAPSPPAKGKAEKAEKAEKASKRTGPAWWKYVKKTWRRLKKAVGGPKIASAVLGVGFLLGCLAVMLVQRLFGGDGRSHHDSDHGSNHDSATSRAAAAAEARAASSAPEAGAPLDTPQGKAAREEEEEDGAPDTQAVS